MTPEIITWMQKRAANGAVGPSTIRGMAPSGTAAIIRAYLKAIEIGSVKASSAADFAKILDALTNRLLRRLPTGSKHWGMARKCINLFLRNCSYNKYLCKYYQLGSQEKWLEIPLDSHVGKGLLLHCEKGVLSKWTSVKTLTPEKSKVYQSFALTLAKKKKVMRIHLDDWLFRGDHIIQQ